MKTPPKNVDAYFKTFEGVQLETLEKLRKAIKAAAPKAEETISYGMPVYKQNGTIAFFAGFKNHCSYFPGGNAIIKMFENELKPYEISKGTIRFAIDKPLPSSLVKKMVQAKIKYNETKLKIKQKKSSVKKKASLK